MKKKRVWIFLSIVLISLFLIGAGVYFYLNSSKVIFSKAMNKMFDNLVEEKGLLDDLDFDTLKVDTKTNLTLASGGESYKLNLAGNVSYNEKNNKLYMDMNTNLNNQKLVDFQGMLDNNKIYFKIKDLMTKFYYIDLEIDSSQEIDEEELEHMLGLFGDSFFDSLKDEDFSNSKQKLELSGKNFATTKLSLKLTEEKIYDITTNFLTALKKDKELMSTLHKFDSEFTEKSIDDVLTEINETMEEVNNNNYVLYTIYVDKNKDILRQEISMNDVDDVTLKDMMFAVNSYKIDNNYEVVEIIVLDKGVEVVNLSVKETSKEDAMLTLTSALIKAEGTIKTTAAESSYDITVTDILGTKLGTIACVTKKEDNKNYMYNLTMNVAIEDVKFALASKNNIVLDSKLTEFDVTGSQSIDTMSQAEQNTILNTIIMRLSAVMQ